MRKTRCVRILTTSVAILYLFLSGQTRAQEAMQAVSSSLSDTLSLVSTPETGDVTYFRISRNDITVNAKGEPTSRAASIGRFKRDVIHGNEAGTHMYRYTWKDFFHTRTEEVTSSLTPVEITAIRGFSYELNSADRQSVPPIYIGGLAKTPDTFAFFVVAWDVAAITHAVTDRFDYPIRSLNRPGDRIVGTEAYLPASFDFTPIVSGFSYTRRPYTATLSGLSLIDEKPVTIIQFESGNNPIAYRYSDGRVSVHLDGREWTTGAVHVGLHDNAIMRGALQTTVVVSQEILLAGKRIQHPMTVFQNVVLEKISEQMYMKNKE